MSAQAADRDQYLKFSRPHNSCLLCGKALNVDGRHPSLIQLSDKEDTIRQDFCSECWEKKQSGDYFSYWVTKRVNSESPEQRRLNRAERNEALWRLFAALYESKDAPELAPQLFLVAHLLMKYKVIVYGGKSPDGKLIFKQMKLGETYEVADVALDGVDFAKVNALVEEQALNFRPEPAGEEASADQ
ncbi:MAG: hypothetical protein ABI579_00230 [Candidatus Sumerlaeota bacterium]